MNTEQEAVEQAIVHAEYVVHTRIPCQWGRIRNNEIEVYQPHPEGGYTKLNAPAIAARYDGDTDKIYSLLYQKFPTKGKHLCKR